MRTNMCFRGSLQFLVCLAVLGGFVVLSSCSGGGSALPQSSIPAPSDSCSDDDCITVSSPDEEGFVTITGSAGAVPNSAVVIVKTSEGTSGLLRRFWDVVCPSAHAQAACTSEFPECSTFENDFEATCQLTAEDDGSFVIRLKIDTSLELTVSYLDPDNSCGEVEKVKGRLRDIMVAGLYPLRIEGQAMTNDGDNAVIVFGQNVDNENQLVKVDIENSRISESHELNIDGAPASILTVLTGDDERFLFLTDEEGVIGEISGGELTLFELLEDVDGSTRPLEAHRSLEQTDFTYELSLAEYSVSCSPEEDTFLFDLLGDTVGRIIAARTLDPSDTFDRANPIAVLDHVTDNLDDLPGMRAIHYGVSAFAEQFSELSTAFFISADDLIPTQDGSRIFLLANMRVSDGTRYYLFEIPSRGVFCGNSVFGRDEVRAEGTDLSVIRLPAALSSPGITASTQLTIDSENRDIFLIPDSEQNTIYVVDIGTGEVYTEAVDPLEDAGLVGARALVLYESSAGVDVFGVGSRPFLMQLDVGDVSASDPFLTEVANENIVGISPLDIQLMGDNLIILNQGRPDDGFSSLRTIDLSE